MADETQNVPRYFADFVKQNADEHGALAAKTEALRGDLGTSLGQLREEIATNRIEIARAETRSTRWMIGVAIGGLTIGVAVLAYVN